MDSIEEQYFGINRRLLLLIGCWYTQSYRERILRYCIIGLILHNYLLFELCQLLTVDFNLQSILLVLQLLIPILSIMSVYYTFIFHFVLIQRIFNYLRHDWQQLKNDVDQKIMQKHAYESKLFTLICGFIFSILGSLLILLPVLRKILYESEDASSTDYFAEFSCINYFLVPEMYFYPILIIQIATAIVLLVVATCCYSTYLFIVQHICARLFIIKTKIRMQFKDNEHKDNVLVTSADLSHWLIDIIQYLAKTREFVNLLNMVTDKCNLFQMSVACVIIMMDILFLFQMPVLLNQKENNKNVFRLTAFIIGSVFPIYVHCYIGQRLIDYSTDVYKEMCQIPIHDISIKTQKLLLTALILDAQPLMISLGKVFVSSHAFFQSLFRVSLSYAMVVHSI